MKLSAKQGARPEVIRSLEEPGDELQKEYNLKTQEPATRHNLHTLFPQEWQTILPEVNPLSELAPDKVFTLLNEATSVTRHKPAALFRRLYFCLVSITILLFIGMFLLRLMGYYLFNVVSDSMAREIPKGSLVIVKRVPSESICTGDNITYERKDGSLVTHKVIHIIENCGGSNSRGFETKGTENDVSDAYTVLAENVIGVVQTHARGIGGFFTLLKPLFYVMIIFSAGWITFTAAHRKISSQIHRHLQVD